MQQIASPSPKFSLEEFDPSCPKKQETKWYLEWAFHYGVHEAEGHWKKYQGKNS